TPGIHRACPASRHDEPASGSRTRSRPASIARHRQQPGAAPPAQRVPGHHSHHPTEYTPGHLVCLAPLEPRQVYKCPRPDAYCLAPRLNRPEPISPRSRAQRSSLSDACGWRPRPQCSPARHRPRIDVKVWPARCAVARLFCSEVAGRVAGWAVPVFGGRGYLGERRRALLPRTAGPGGSGKAPARSSEGSSPAGWSTGARACWPEALPGGAPWQAWSVAADLTGEFEAQRGRLFGLAYRLLGSATDAEDVVQDAFLRWNNADRVAIAAPAAW